MSGGQDLRDVRRYRSGSEPMQVLSGPIGTPKIHFEAPPSAQVPSEMAQFIAWFNRSAPAGAEPLTALTRAGVAHLYFESVHPFEDGNGRIGRAISEKSLAQSLGQPSLMALASTIFARRARYYTALEAAIKENEVTNWLAWFAGVTIEAQRRTVALIEFLIDRTRLLNGLNGKLNERQQKASEGRRFRSFRSGRCGSESA